MITAEHSSGRFDVEPAVLEVALAQQLVDEPDFLSLTEMMSEARAAVLGEFPAYTVVRHQGADGQDECALLVRSAAYRVVSSRAVKLSDLPIPLRGGKFCFALHVVVEDVITKERHHRLVVHMPSGVEGVKGFRDSAQARVYRNAIGGLREYVATLTGPVVITGDYNLSLRVAWVREYFTRALPGFTRTWNRTNLPTLGTHGSRVIDYTLMRGFSVSFAQVRSSFGASDHRVIREHHERKETTTVTTPDPYAHSTFHGKPLDNATIAALKLVEAKLGYTDGLTILQGIGGAPKSAGTHLEGRAVDLAPFDRDRKLRALKDAGFAAWYREAVPNLWGAHIHAVLIFENRANSRGLADVGFRQIASFDAKRDGLKSSAPDPSYRPSPPAVFTLAEYKATFAPVALPLPTVDIKPTHVEAARDHIRDAYRSLRLAIEELEAAGDNRTDAKAWIPTLKSARRQLGLVLQQPPER